MHRSQRLALLRAWLPAAIGVLVICAESTDFFSAAHTSVLLQRFWALFGRSSNVDWSASNHILRKTGHFIGYGTLSLLFYRAWRRSSEVLVIYRPRIVDVVYAFACTLVVACGDEYHQSFLTSRTGQPQDVFLDMTGAVVFLLLLQIWLCHQRRLPTAARAKNAPEPLHSED